MTVDYADELYEADLVRYFLTEEAFDNFNFEMYEAAIDNGYEQ